MRNYFTISEFARLRNININSLRYYEKIGLLKPTHVDPHTNYRYYTAEQLSVLDTILLCIDLKIPLKELERYVDETGAFHSQRLFQDGKNLAMQRINEIQVGLSKIELALQSIETSKAYTDRQGIYQRHIPQRRFFISKYVGELENIAKLEKEFANLYMNAQAEQLSPIFPAGVLLQYSGEVIRFFLFCEIANHQRLHEHILDIPQGNYLCVQSDLRPATNLLEIVEHHFSSQQEKTVIATNMLTEKYNLDSRKSEVQMADRILIPDI